MDCPKCKKELDKSKFDMIHIDEGFLVQGRCKHCDVYTWNMVTALNW